MALVGWILLGLLALGLGAVLVLLATPLHLAFAAEAEGVHGRLVLDARTFWGLAPRLRVLDTARPRKPDKAKPEEPRKRQSGTRKRRGPTLTFERVQRLAAGVPDLLGGELARIHLDQLSLDARFGTGDPAETGRLYALPGRACALTLVPDFNRACFEAKGEAALHFTPAALTVPVIRLAWNVFVRPA
jgi:hypothetical protein